MPQLYMDNKFSALERAENLLYHMTLREKIGQLNQRLYGFTVYERHGQEITLTKELKEEVEKFGGLGVLYGLYRADPWSGKNFTNGLTGQLAIKAYNMVQRYVIEHSRLGIPMLLSSECPHGHQALEGYLLPVNLCTGATFHPELLQKAYEVCGAQLKEMGVDMALVSTLDVLRDPRWGRSEECYSEDPYLASEFAKAAVTGIQSQGVAVVAKHFCAQGEGTGGINASAARIGERELREIHLPTAKACCDAGVQGIMAAYNEIDGVPCHANNKLLTQVLRKELGFEGVVMSDGVAIDQLDVMTGDRVASGAIALKAGVDIGLWDTGFGRLEEAYAQGLVSMEDINKSVLRVLTMKFERGLFEKPYLPEVSPLSSFHYDQYPEALQLARESVVLLKNDNNLLPLNLEGIRSIAVIGPNADELYNQLGDYTPPIREDEGSTVLQGIKTLIKNSGDNIDIKYCRGCGLLEGTKEGIAEAVELSRTCDITLLVLGGSSSRFGKVQFDSNGAAIIKDSVSMDCGEGVDSGNLELPKIQQQLAQAIYNTQAIHHTQAINDTQAIHHTQAINHTQAKVVTVLIQGRPYAIPDIAKQSASVLCCFYPGMKGGQAIAEILFGYISPSGRLPVSIPRHVGQLPVYYNYKSSYAAMNYYDLEKQPLYHFGYGLSYTRFQYQNIKLVKDTLPLSDLFHSGIQLIFDITNIGEINSYAVPQLYIRDVQASTIRRVRELKDFTKVWVPKGETVQVILTLDQEKLSIWNDEMKFVVEPGDFQLFLSDCGEDIWEGVFTLPC